MEIQKVKIPRQKRKKCATSTNSGCEGYVVAWSEWKDNGYGFVYRTPEDVRCHKCGHSMGGNQAAWMFNTDPVGRPLTGDGHIPSKAEAPWLYDMAMLD